MTISLDLRTKISNKKQKSRFAITDITNQDLRKLLKKFKNSPYIGYKSKQINNEPTEAYFFLIKHITKLMKSKSRVQSKFIKLGANEKIDKLTEKLDTSMKQYNMRNWKETTKGLRARIKIRNFECI